MKLGECVEHCLLCGSVQPPHVRMIGMPAGLPAVNWGRGCYQGTFPLTGWEPLNVMRQGPA